MWAQCLLSLSCKGRCPAGTEGFLFFVITNIFPRYRERSISSLRVKRGNLKHMRKEVDCFVTSFLSGDGGGATDCFVISFLDLLYLADLLQAYYIRVP